MLLNAYDHATTAIIQITAIYKFVFFNAAIGTGKTATFSISILQQIDTSIKECQALILAPTRELAQQVSTFLPDSWSF